LKENNLEVKKSMTPENLKATPYFVIMIHSVVKYVILRFENRVLRKIFRPEGENLTRRYGKLHNEELHNLYSSVSIIREGQTRR
jgi:hypothetical protein